MSNIFVCWCIASTCHSSVWKTYLIVDAFQVSAIQVFGEMIIQQNFFCLTKHVHTRPHDTFGLFSLLACSIKLVAVMSAYSAEAAPEAAQKALQGPVQAALQQGQDEDRARTSAAAEALSGLVASGKAYKATSGEFNSALSLITASALCSVFQSDVLLNKH